MGDKSVPLKKRVMTDKSQITHEIHAISILPDESFFAIDVDDNQKLSLQTKEWLINNENLICASYHSTKELPFKTVINEKTFKLLFKYDKVITASLLKIQNKLNALNIELFIRKTRGITVAGYHRKMKSRYFFAGGSSLSNLNLMPKIFFDILDRNCKDVKVFSTDSGDIRYTTIRNVSEVYAKRKIAELTSIYECTLPDMGIKTKVVSHCPNSHKHKGKERAKSDFGLLFDPTTKIMTGGCYHHSCAEDNKKLILNFFRDHNPGTVLNNKIPSVNNAKIQIQNLDKLLKVAQKGTTTDSRQIHRLKMRKKYYQNKLIDADNLKENPMLP